MQVASAAECRLSARDAVSAVGFGEPLGDLNVMIGTDIHKRWIKEAYGSGKLADEVVPLVDALRRGLLLAVRTLSGGMMGHLALPDLFKPVRFAVLSAQLERLLGEKVLEGVGGVRFIQAFIAFQDGIESATARAAGLPRWGREPRTACRGAP